MSEVGEESGSAVQVFLEEWEASVEIEGEKEFLRILVEPTFV